MIVIPPITITDAILDSSNVPEADFAEWVISTAYVAPNNVMVSVVEPDIHRNYEALQATTGDEPWLEPTPAVNWLDLGATNRWAMFDNKNGSSTTNADSIDVSITPGELINSVSLLNISAATVQVIVTDPTEGEVYNRTIDLISPSGINDWYAYYFTPIERQTNALFLDLPAFSQATIQIIATETGADVSIGVLALGVQNVIGIANHGTSVGIIDYSVKSVDSFGNFVILPRAFSKRADYIVTMDTERTGFVQDFLASIRSQPVIWIGSDVLGSTIVYGYYRSFDILLSNFTSSDANISVEGLT
jgi:hypothetical protein